MSKKSWKVMRGKQKGREGKMGDETRTRQKNSPFHFGGFILPPLFVVPFNVFVFVVSHLWG